MYHSQGDTFSSLFNFTHKSIYYIIRFSQFGSVQFSSVTQSCLTLCDPIDCSMSGFPVHHQLPELAQTHVRRVDDAC